MKKVSVVTMCVAMIALISSFTVYHKANNRTQAEGIKWMTWQQMQEAQKKEPRKVFIDTYTDWCGWCKKMDQSTFTHPEIIKYLNENFYAVKFNAETRETIRFKGKDYKFIPSGNRGYNELADELLNGRLSYPTTVYLDENMNLLFPVPGYLDPKTLEQVLNFVGGNNYKTMTFDIFQPKFKGKIQ
jgi:thioredoxin-related protein